MNHPGRIFFIWTLLSDFSGFSEFAESVSSQSSIPALRLTLSSRSDAVTISATTGRPAGTRPCWQTFAGPLSTRCRSGHAPWLGMAVLALQPSSAPCPMVRKHPDPSWKQTFSHLTYCFSDSSLSSQTLLLLVITLLLMSFYLTFSTLLIPALVLLHVLSFTTDVNSLSWFFLFLSFFVVASH